MMEIAPDGPPIDQLSEHEIQQLRGLLRENNEKAREEARKQGVKLHPRVVAAKKKR